MNGRKKEKKNEKKDARGGGFKRSQNKKSYNLAIRN
jgi:hypothetical protein